MLIALGAIRISARKSGQSVKNLTLKHKTVLLHLLRSLESNMRFCNLEVCNTTFKFIEFFQELFW